MSQPLSVPLLIPLVSAAILGLVLRKIGLSLVAGYILAGVLVGPVLNLVDPSSPVLAFVSELGITLISFEIGLMVRLDFMSNGGLRMLAVVLSEVTLVSLLSYVAGSLLQLSWGNILVLMLITVNTSTAVCFRIMEERGFMDRPTLNFTFGVGTVEDIIVLIGLSVLPVVATAGRSLVAGLTTTLLTIVVSTTLMLVFGLSVIRPLLNRFVGRDPEVFLTMILAMVLGYAYIGGLIGVSSALGAFLAGLVMSTLDYRDLIADRMRPLRRFASLIFFASIGASLPYLSETWLVAGALTVCIMIVAMKFVGFSLSSWVSGLDLEKSFRIGLYMIAISELGVIVAREGLRLGISSKEMYVISALSLVMSSILSASATKYETRISGLLASSFPIAFRSYVERLSLILRRGIVDRRDKLGEISKEFKTLVRRTAIIVCVGFLAAFAVRLASDYVPVSLADYLKAATSVVAVATILLVILNARFSLKRMILFAVQQLTGERSSVLASVTLSLISALLTLVSVLVLLGTAFFYVQPLLTMLFGFAPTVLVMSTIMVVVLVIFIGRSAELVRRLEKFFGAQV